MKQRLGTVYTITPSGLITVRLGNIKRIPKLGMKVYTRESEEPIGRLIDVIGPVNNPFGVVKIEIGAGIGIGDVLYIEPPRKPGKKFGKRSGRSLPKKIKSKKRDRIRSKRKKKDNRPRK